MRRSFDNLARFYIGLERLMFGRKLESARNACLTSLKTHEPQRALILGDGDGRFSYNALKGNPLLTIHSIERSASMRKYAQKRIQQLGEDASRRYVHIAYDARSFLFPFSEYDIVVAQFFLDCFHSSNANRLLSGFARSLKPEGKLVYTDFSTPRQFPANAIGLTTVYSLYLFFRLTTDIESKRLPLLKWPNTLKLLSKEEWLNGLITSETWAKT